MDDDERLANVLRKLLAYNDEWGTGFADIVASGHLVVDSRADLTEEEEALIRSLMAAESARQEAEWERRQTESRIGQVKAALAAKIQEQMPGLTVYID